MKQQLIAISGPSCGGKTTLKKTLLALGSDKTVEVVTTTTRVSRPGEADDGAYRFVSEASFSGLIDAGELLEWVRYDNHYYGIEHHSLNRFHDSGKTGVIVATDDGVAALSTWCERNGVELVRVLATAPADELLRRLASRADASAAAIRRRRDQLLREQQQPMDFSKYDWIVDPASGKRLMDLAAAPHK